jgi:magnesium transporter
MIEYQKVDAGKVVPASDPQSAEIVRMIAPSSAELENVRTLTSAPIDFLSAACDKDERPRFETDEGVHLVVLRVPFEDHNSAVPVVTVAFGLVLTPHHIVSVCSVASDVWTLLGTGRGRVPAADNRIALISTLSLCIARLYLKHLDFIRAEANRVELEIHHSMRNEMLIRMLNLEKCLVYFTTSLRGHDPIWPRLKRIEGRDLTEDELELLEDVIIEFRQARDLAEIHSNILSGMMDAFASVISNNLNVVMKLLTSITIILMLPTLIASVYGMNVKLPFQDSPHAFLITMGMSAVLSAVGMILFHRKKFF